MGNDFSSGNHLHIQTDRPFYCSGEGTGDVVSGHVLLNCVTPFQCDQVGHVRMHASACNNAALGLPEEGLKGRGLHGGSSISN